MTTRPKRIRESRASFAVIERVNDGDREWLVQWNSAWRAYNLVGGHRQPDESYDECLVRELGEELDLKPLVDFTVDPTSAHLEFMDWSERAGQFTRYEMELFRVRLTATAQQRVSKDPANRWITRGEIRDRQTHDGQPVSKTISRLLESVGALPAHHAPE